MSERLRKFDPDVARIAPLLEELFPGMGDGELPSTIVGWADANGRPRRCRADYPNGWRVEFRLNAKGQLTSRTGSLKLGGAMASGRPKLPASPEHASGGSTFADSDGDDGS